jgi:hypothetical protein
VSKRPTGRIPKLARVSQPRTELIDSAGAFLSSIEVNISRAIRNSVIMTVPVAEAIINYGKYFPGNLIFTSRLQVRAYDKAGDVECRRRPSAVLLSRLEIAAWCGPIKWPRERYLVSGRELRSRSLPGYFVRLRPSSGACDVAM